MKIFALAFAALAASPAHALTLPSLDKKDDAPVLSASVDMSFETTDDSSIITPEQLDAISTAFILSANEAHDSADYHMKSFQISKAGKDVVDTHAFKTMLRSSAAKEEGDKYVSVSRNRYSLYNQGQYDYICGPTCNNDVFLTSQLEQINGNVLKLWEVYFCDILNQNAAFNDVAKCKIKVSPKVFFVSEV